VKRLPLIVAGVVGFAITSAVVGAIALLLMLGGGTTTCDSSAASGTISGNNNTQRVFTYLASRPQLTRVQAAAIVGNLIHESGGDANLAILTNNANKSSGANGMAQWYQARLARLKAFNFQGLPWTDIDLQIHYLWWELTQDPATTFNALQYIQQTTDIATATTTFEQKFERSGVTSSYPIRISNARKVLAKYGDGVAVDENVVACDAGDLPTGDASPAAVKTAADALDKMHVPYNFGGGHITPAKPTGGEEGPYLGLDCSSSVSWVLQHAGIKVDTMVSGAFMSWGDSGPGKYVTLYASPDHIFMSIRVNGKLRYFGTSGFGHPAAGTGPAWFTQPVNAGYIAGFVQRHPPGL
jgi:cell wall-associated NlpC family hydrolase